MFRKENLFLPRNLIVLTCKMLVKQKLDSGPFGNVSIRNPGTQEFWINPARIIFDHLVPENILKMDMKGNILEGNAQMHPGEFIHREIYRLRPEVNAIVHTHSENTVAISLLGCEIE